MEMPDRYTINPDGSLTVYVDSQEYTFAKNQFLKSDKGRILMKHQAIVMLAEMTGVKVKEPVLLSNYNPVIYVFSRTAVRGNDTFAAVGESNHKNLFCDVMMMTPATTADNRAYERAVLGILGLHGDIYGASEMNFKDGDKPQTEQKKSEPAAKKEEVTPKEETNKSSEENQTGNAEPFWWNDTGKGVYTDRVLDPETFIITEGPCGGKNWTTKQLYDYQYKSCLYFAERSGLENATDDFKKQVYSCRRAIREYGLRD